MNRKIVSSICLFDLIVSLSCDDDNEQTSILGTWKYEFAVFGSCDESKPNRTNYYCSDFSCLEITFKKNNVFQWEVNGNIEDPPGYYRVVGDKLDLCLYTENDCTSLTTYTIKITGRKLVLDKVISGCGEVTTLTKQGF